MMLHAKFVHVHYGSAHVLHGINLEIGARQIVCLVGRNGAGKSTTLKTIMGLARVSSGEITFLGERIDEKPTHQIARLGIAYVPEDRRVFGSLTVAENVRVAAQVGNRSSSDAVREALELFPDLLAQSKHAAANLSGGQQQMLAIARAVAASPRLLLLDEPTEGLSPRLVRSVESALLQRRASGTSIFLVEQNLNLALALADVLYVLSRGAVAFRGSVSELLQRRDIIAEHLGLSRVKELPR
ncbi:MAG TPA: ABC transporter ATP-binding protein [Xanthobacteraceae bacterium]|nr:ABC transporter ATP-binding protein [Xanthobacteraceae bacterium]